MHCVEVSLLSIVTTESWKGFLWSWRDRNIGRQQVWQSVTRGLFSPAGFVPLVGIPVAVISSVVGLVCASPNVTHTNWGNQPMRIPGREISILVLCRLLIAPKEWRSLIFYTELNGRWSISSIPSKRF
jgi:hypothetical protein